MTDLIAEIQKAVDRKSELRLLDAVATGANTVTVGQSTVAVTLPAIIPVVSGDFCQVLEQGLNRVIIGPTHGGWQTLTLASGNWTLTQQPEWRYNAGKIELRGAATRTTSTFGGGGTMFNLTGANPPPPAQTYELGAVVRNTVSPALSQWVVSSGGAFTLQANSPTLNIGATVRLDEVAWPIA